LYFYLSNYVEYFVQHCILYKTKCTNCYMCKQVKLQLQ